MAVDGNDGADGDAGSLQVGQQEGNALLGLTSVLVRTRKKHQSAKCEPLVQILVPFMMYLSPLRMAVVLSEARSEPALGSEKPCDQITSPASMGGRKRFFCSSLPN